jgi:hypothetical protein
MTTEPATVFAVDLASLAREIAMDIFPVEQVLEIHKLTDDEWQKILGNQTFQSMLASMQRDWNSAANTRERVRVKAATGLESMLEQYVREIGDESIPLTQRVEAGKFLARLGELDGAHDRAGGAAGTVTINITTSQNQPTITLTATRSPVLDLEQTVDSE